tara:strand:+ start:528 stop:1037 length:510 start_codon:yes stop_codon:yes gene_type:complete
VQDLQPWVVKTKKRKVVEESKQIEKWIRQVVAKTHKESKSPVCPYAKTTLEDGKIQISPAKTDVLDQIDICCSLFTVFGLDIVILYFNNKITEKNLSAVCKKAHKKNPAFAIMYDHPANNGLHKGVSFSYGRKPLVMIQDLAKLKRAQKHLKRTGYYDKWGLDGLDQFY